MSICPFSKQSPEPKLPQIGLPLGDPIVYDLLSVVCGASLTGTLSKVVCDVMPGDQPGSNHRAGNSLTRGMGRMGPMVVCCRNCTA